MRVMNSGTSTIVIRRNGSTTRINPGENRVSEYEWMGTFIEKHPGLKYILDVKVNEAGAIEEEDKVIAPAQKRTITVEAPVQKEVSSTKKKTKKKTSGKHS